jgi:hypothetical protein
LAQQAETNGQLYTEKIVESLKVIIGHPEALGGAFSAAIIPDQLLHGHIMVERVHLYWSEAGNGIEYFICGYIGLVELRIPLFRYVKYASMFEKSVHLLVNLLG